MSFLMDQPAPSSLSDSLPADACRSLVDHLADIVLEIDESAKIIRAESNVTIADIAAYLGVATWVGRSLDSVLLPDSLPKAERMVKDARAGETVEGRHLNHRAPGPGPAQGRAFDYQAFDNIETGTIMLVGKSLETIEALQMRLLRAQQALEQEYDRFRETESRLRQLYQVSNDPTLVIDPAAYSVVEANRAARALCQHTGISDDDLIGSRFPSETLDVKSGSGHEQLTKLLENASTGRASSTRVIGVPLSRAAPSDTDSNKPLDGELTIQFVARDPLGNLILRLGLEGDSVNMPLGPSAIESAVDLLSDAMVMVDSSGSILDANQRFVDLCEVNTREAITAAPIDRWLGLGGLSFATMTKTFKESSHVRFLAASIEGDHGMLTPVEASVTRIDRGSVSTYAMVLRDIAARTGADNSASSAPASSTDVSDLIGQMSLKDIVRETTDVIEQLSIEAALKMTGDNRASAAEILGLSRQSLYVKMRRFGIERLNDSDT